MNWQIIRTNAREYGISVGIIVLVIVSVVRVVSTDPATEDVVEYPTVKLLEVSSLQSTEQIVATGTIESADQITIMSEVSAPVRTVFAKPGELVAPGTPILEFVHDDYDAQLAQAQASVQAVQAQLALQTAPARTEDLRRAELAVAQAEAGLQTALTNQERTLQANEDLLEGTQDAVEQLYSSAYLAALSANAALKDALVTVSDYQLSYFNCTDAPICFAISEAKELALFTAYGARYAGHWSSASVQSVRTGVVAELESINANDIDGGRVGTSLEKLYAALLDARKSVAAVREGFDSYPRAADATATDRSIVEGKRAAVEAALVAVEAKLNAYQTIQGGLRGGGAASLEDARTTAEQNARIAEATVLSARATLETTTLTLQQLIDGPRPLDLGPLYAQLAQADAAYRQASASQRRYIIAAPFEGEIISIDAKPGELFSPGRPIVTIANPHALEISVFISADDRRSISRHAMVRINDAASGVITSIGSGVDPATGKVEVRVAVVEDSELLLVGEAVTVAFEKEQTTGEGTQVPLSAVKTTPEGSYVFSIGEGNILIPNKVTTGSIEADRIWVNFDSSAPLYIVENARGLRAGDQIKQ